MAMFFVRFDSPWYIKIFARFEGYIKYQVLRPVASWLYWHWKGKLIYKKVKLNYSGQKLKKGISFVMPAKNEEYSLKPCLESLIEIADQFILIDNGSQDNTLQVMEDFKNKMENKVEVIILQKPGLNLLQIRQEGLKHVKYSHVIRGDADMVFTEEMHKIKTFALQQKRPTAIFLKKFNFFGDLEHVHRLNKPYAGEYFLRSFDNSMKFKEYYGRLEHAPLPLYYKMKKWNNVAFFHNERLIYRTFYLDWRETINQKDEDENNGRNLNFDDYQKLWTKHNFQTLDPDSLNFRYSRLIASACKPIHKQNLNFPEPLRIQTEKEPFRFFIEYKNNKPWLRHDSKNPDLKTYIPTKEDLSWTPSIEEFKNDKKRKGFVYKPEINK
jgi:glycosyltransferase involved in cell wall biosynthesis